MDENTDPDLLWASVLNFGEILKGIERLPAASGGPNWKHGSSTILRILLPVTKAIAERWGILSAQALDKGRSLNVVDGLLAATAIEHSLTLVTRNVRQFTDRGVPIFNPWDGTAPAG